MPTDPPGLGQAHAAEMRGLAQRLDSEQILRSPWGNLSARDRARLLLWKGRPEVAVVRDGEVFHQFAGSRPKASFKAEVEKVLA